VPIFTHPLKSYSLVDPIWKRDFSVQKANLIESKCMQVKDRAAEIHPIPGTSSGKAGRI